MEFRKIVTMTLYTREQKSHRYKKQTFEFCGRRQGWADLREQHWSMYITIFEIDDQSKFDVWNRALKAGALGQPRGMVWGGRREEGSGWGTRVYLWRIHVDIWQNQYNIVKFKNKAKKIFKQRNIHNVKSEVYDYILLVIWNKDVLKQDAIIQCFKLKIIFLK